MSKRAGFVLVAVILALGMWLTQLLPLDMRLTVILVLTIVSYFLTVWVLFEDLKGVEWLMLTILPVLFTLSAGLFAYYLPSAVPSLFGFKFGIGMSRFLASLVSFVFFVLYGVGMYAILLTENIFSVASIRTIQLLRAARSVGFILSLVVGIFFFHTFLALRVPFFVVAGTVFMACFLLSLSALWSVELKMVGLNEVLVNSLVVAFIMSQMGMVMSFWPVQPLMGGLMLVACFYSLLGLFQQRMTNRVFFGGFVEYLVFMVIVLATGFLTTSWRG
jgi:hypothetical protein